jgi:hypothetical protein
VLYKIEKYKSDNQGRVVGPIIQNIFLENSKHARTAALNELTESINKYYELGYKLLKNNQTTNAKK